MVTEAVGEMKGEPIVAAGRDQARRADRRLPADRLRGQGGAAARGLPPPRRRHDQRPRSTTSAPSGRTATARCPTPAEALLTVGHLRAECHRLGITDIQIAADQARLAPLDLKLSAATRLKRLSKGRDPQGGPAAARGADPARPRPGIVPRRLPARARPRSGPGPGVSAASRLHPPGSLSDVTRRRAPASPSSPSVPPPCHRVRHVRQHRRRRRGPGSHHDRHDAVRVARRRVLRPTRPVRHPAGRESAGRR